MNVINRTNRRVEHRDDKHGVSIERARAQTREKRDGIIRPTRAAAARCVIQRDFGTRGDSSAEIKSSIVQPSLSFDNRVVRLMR